MSVVIWWLLGAAQVFLMAIVGTGVVILDQESDSTYTVCHVWGSKSMQLGDMCLVQSEIGGAKGLSLTS